MRYDILYLDKGLDVKAFETYDLTEAYQKLNELRLQGFKGLHIQSAIPDAMKKGGILPNYVVYSDPGKEIRLIGGEEVYYKKKDAYWIQLPITEKDVKQGVNVELEHKDTLQSFNTDPKFSAKLIALDHLIEDKDYYKKLSKIEQFNDGGKIPNDFENKSIKSYLESVGFSIGTNGIVKYESIEVILWQQRKYEIRRGSAYMVEVGSPEEPINPEEKGLKIAVIDNILNNSGRGKGLASFVLDKIIEGADLTKTTLQLIPEQQGQNGLSTKELTDWYAKRGFEFINEDVMERKPVQNKVRNIDIFYGKEIKLSMPNDEKRNGAYAIVELDDILASHNENTFQNTIGYPVDAKGDNINDRNYTGDKSAQGKVIEFAQNLEPDRLITTSKTPSGSPIIDINGFVVSGNNRTMSLKLAKQVYPEKYNEYKDILKEEIESFGFERASKYQNEFFVTNRDNVTKQFTNPVFVRVDFDIPELNQLELSKYNKDTKKSEKPIDKSIKLSKILANQPACKESIGLIVGNYETFSEFYANYNDCKQVVDTLVGCNILSSQELPAYFSERGFTEQGKDLLENTLMGLILDKPALIIADEIRSIRKMLVTCLPVLSLNSTFEQFTLIPELNKAILLENEIKSSKLSFNDWLKTYGLFDEKPDQNIVYMNRFLQLGRNAFKQKLESYNNSAKENSGDSLFGDQLSKQELFNNFVKGSIPIEESTLIENVYQQLKAEQKQPEVKNMSSTNIFVGGEWYKNNPTKVLAVTQLETDRYGKPISTYKGSIDNVDRIDADMNVVILQQQNPLLSDIPKDANELTEKDTQQLENVKNALVSSDKEIKKKRGRKNKIDAEKNTIATSSGQEIETRSLEEVYNEINPEVSKEDLQAFLWFNLRYGKPVQNSQWYELANTTMGTLSTLTDAQLSKWIEQGVAFWNGEKNRIEPGYLYLSGDVYAKYNRLVIKDGAESGEKDISYILNTYGEKALKKQIDSIELLFQKQYESRLIINSNDPNGLVLLPNSKFSKNFYISTQADELPFKWKKITAQSNKRYGQFDYLATYVNEQDKKVIDKLNLQNAFCYWLRTDTTAGIKQGLTYADIINYYIFAKPKPRTVAEKEWDGTYSAASKKIIKEENASFERLKAKTKQEGDRLFTVFLDKNLLFNDKLRLELEWNMRYNNNVPINYNKIPVSFRMNKFIQGNPLDVRPEKREAVAFTIGNGSGLLAYDVGVGKTPSAIFTVSSFIDLGWCKRPLFVVPNQTYKQWISEFKNFAGHLKINKMYNLNDTLIEEFQDSNGVTLEVAEQSITIMTYEGLFALGFNEETSGTLQKELFSILIQSSIDIKDKEFEKQLLKTNTKVEEILGKALRQTKLNIEDLGIDYICIDEAHACKKVFTFVAGESSENTGTSDKESRAVVEYKIAAGQPSFIGIKGFAICNYIQTKYNGNSQLLTATPFTNSPLEIYSMLAMVSYNELKVLGLSNLKEFFDTFIKISYEIVINSALNPVRKQIVLGFNNLLVLQKIVKKFINHKTGESVGVQRPKKYVLPYKRTLKDGVYMTLPENEQVDTAIPLTPIQSSFMALIKKYAEGTIKEEELGMESWLLAKGLSNSSDIDKKEYIEEDPEVDTDEVDIDEDSLNADEKAGVRLLLSLNHARNLALSPYLYKFSYLSTPTPTEYIETSGKLTYVVECIRSIKKHHEKTNTKMSGIVIYMERGTDYFELLRDYLISNLGFNANEVGIISSKVKMPIERGIKDEDAKEYVKNLFLGKKFNNNTLELESVPDSDRLKVLIGSSTIKEGINLQTYSSTLFNCFLAWNPTDIQQLEGRIYRQGNHFKNVRIVNPLMIDSADIFMFQKLEEKTARINSTFETDGKTNVLNTEELNPKELKYSLIKNPQVIAQLEVQEETESLTDKISDLKNDQKRVNEYKSNLSNTNYYLEKLDNAIKTYRPSYIDKSIDSKLKALTNYFNTRLDEDGKFTSSGRIYESGKGWIDEPVPKGKQLSPHENMSKPSWFSNMQDYHRKVVRFEKDFLAPRGIKPGAEAGVNLLLDIDFQIKATEEEIKQLTSEEALAKRVREIEIKREELQVREKSMSELILEFERLNYLLDDVKLPDVNKPVALSCPPLDANGVPRIDPEGLDLLNDCIKQQAQTKYIHSKEIKNEDGTTGYVYSPERQKLHKEIIKELTRNAVCIEQDKPIAVIMGGAPGSGKSTFLKTNAPYMQSDMIWKVDADEVRSFLPEYKGWNSSATHEETRDIVNDLLDSFDTPCKHDLLYDGTMSNVKKYQPIIKRLKKLGYQTFLVFLDIPKEKSIERALKRYRDNNGNEAEFGRYVPISVIEDFYSTGDKAFQILKDSVDGYIKVESLTQNVIERGGIQIPETRPYYKLSQPESIELKSKEKEVTLDELKITLSGAKTSLRYLSGQDKTDMENFIKGLETVIKYK